VVAEEVEMEMVIPVAEVLQKVVVLKTHFGEVAL
jgi:hypothetical protein